MTREPSDQTDAPDLVHAADVAEITGITNPGGVSVYRGRYGDLPAPIIERRNGPVRAVAAGRTSRRGRDARASGERAQPPRSAR